MTGIASLSIHSSWSGSPVASAAGTDVQSLQPDQGQAAIRDWFRARHDRTGNLRLLPGIFPDQILTTPAECDRWLEADTLDALKLQRPLPGDALRIVAKGEKEDPPAGSRLFA